MSLNRCTMTPECCSSEVGKNQVTLLEPTIDLSRNCATRGTILATWANSDVKLGDLYVDLRNVALAVDRANAEHFPNYCRADVHVGRHDEIVQLPTGADAGISRESAVGDGRRRSHRDHRRPGDRARLVHATRRVHSRRRDGGRVLPGAFPKVVLPDGERGRPARSLLF